ncbi:phosphatidylserine decarboxylase proenzyme [Alphaproteobacteria bacterium]|nr:phosphatidylserine decarboxylase proenzyme [Alphaproteobacteria bacterium]
MVKKTKDAIIAEEGAAPDLSIKHWLFPQINDEGFKFVAIAACMSALLAFAWWFLGLIGLGLTVWVYLFFRDPERYAPSGPRLVVSPADGTVCRIDREIAPPAELDIGDAPMQRVCVFMSVFNVHVNRSPVAGEIVKTVYVPGKFLNASMDKASDDNERSLMLLREENTGAELVVVQIAGLVARRIVLWASAGETLERGQRFGLIRFGSRLDVYLPKDAEIAVRLGQTMVAGETVVARLGKG